MITIGENAIILRNLLDGDTPILISSLNYLRAEVWQWGKIMANYVLLPGPADPEISGTSNQVKVQISEALSLKLYEGILTVRIIGKQTDAAYTVDGSLIDYSDDECFEVVL